MKTKTQLTLHTREDFQHRPKVGVGVIIEKNGKVLLQKRQGSHGAGTWSVPGGHIEFGESFLTTAKNEVYEEMGLRVSSVEFITATNDVFVKEQKHYITIFLKAKWSGTPVIKEPKKCTEIGWFSWDNLPEPLFIPLHNFVKMKIYQKK